MDDDNDDDDDDGDYFDDNVEWEVKKERTMKTPFQFQFNLQHSLLYVVCTLAVYIYYIKQLTTNYNLHFNNPNQNQNQQEQ